MVTNSIYFGEMQAGLLKQFTSWFLLSFQSAIRLTKSGVLEQQAGLSRRTIMVAILQTIGPVSNCRAIRGNWRCLKAATTKQFDAAALELENLGFGRLVPMSPTNHSQRVFVKKNPKEAQPALEANPDLCRIDVYSSRYHRPATKKINLNTRAKLVAMGVVSETQLL